MIINDKKLLVSFYRNLQLEMPKMFLVDVGVSGGINEVWREWHSNLYGVGFDPLVNEIARLKNNEDGNFQYQNYFVVDQENNSEEKAMIIFLT